MIRLGKITLHNFGIYKGTVELDFEGKDIVGILAEYVDNPNRSNRSGKTLILEAIRYNLTGLCRAKKEVHMIHDGEDVMWTEGEYLDQDDNVYTVKRGRDHKNNGLLNLDWVEKTTEAQNAIEELFGVSRDDFDLTCFFKQSDINGFMDLSPTEKTSFLMKWLDNEHWKDKEAKVKADIKVYKDRLRDNETTIKALNSSTEVTEELEEELKQLKKENKGLKAEDGKFSKLYAQGDSKLRKIQAESDSAKKQLRKLKDDVDTAKRNQTAFENAKAKLQELKQKGEALKKLSNASKVIKIDVAKKNLVEKQGALRDLKKHLNLLNNGEGFCPILEKSCDLVKFSASDIDPCEDAIVDTQHDITGLNQTIKRYDGAVQAGKDVVTLRERYKETKTRFDELGQAQSTTKAEKAYNEAEKSVKGEADYYNIKEKLDKIESKREDITHQVNRNNQRIGALESRIKSSSESLGKVDELSERNEKLKQRLEELNYLALMFGKNGIPADEIENAFQEVQEDINFILKAIDCGLTVSFSPDKELAKWEAICHCGFRYPKGYRKGECEECSSIRLKQRKDEISLTILEGDKEADFGMDSGGGKTIISYAVRIALTMLKRRQNKSKLNILFLDEVDSALDSHLAASITDSITKILTKKLGYDQILMVSHKDEIKNSVPHILKVTRYENYSKAAFA